ncbi:pyroglutamyl-peptidase I [Thermoflavimicrobium dichotomicum]|uniref:Pyrrolidone-carboxylate peptidase n=1 Tax=Thermoflavimicrobium dichotomicum TaxID=46223 RepID=A0A1I3L3V4_9BACL|nr:pyroglutamyl-peptidase I [Thermoflavimicrobium dichotomicum]SFI79420.1 pyroglutamyl-peptidase [Thermoflavimicrobium dichotomicum]
MKKVLLTGFDPFGGEKINPSWEVVKQFQYISIEDANVYVEQIPTVFRRSIEVLAEKMEEIKPDIVVCVGQAGGRTGISVERVAINIDDARIPDNEGNQPIDVPIVPDGPVAYWSTLPIKAMVENIRSAGIPASVSHTAGTFVCNHLFYGLAHLIATEYPYVRGGFIHIPYLPEQVAHRPDQPSMSLETIAKGLQIAIQTCMEREEDIQITGGQIC